MNARLMRLKRAGQLVVAQLAYQPKRKATVALILRAEELPGKEWKNTLRQAFPTGAFDRDNAIRVRSKEIQSSTVRHEFQSISSSRALLISITPLANRADAESWVKTADARITRSVSESHELKDVQAINDVDLSNVGSTQAFLYTFVRPKGLRIAVVVASNVGDVFTMVTGLSFDEPWRIDEVLEIAQLQVEKIRSARNVALE